MDKAALTLACEVSLVTVSPLDWSGRKAAPAQGFYSRSHACEYGFPRPASPKPVPVEKKLGKRRRSESPLAASGDGNWSPGRMGRSALGTRRPCPRSGSAIAEHLGQDASPTYPLLFRALRLTNLNASKLL